MVFQSIYWIYWGHRGSGKLQWDYGEYSYLTVIMNYIDKMIIASGPIIQIKHNSHSFSLSHLCLVCQCCAQCPQHFHCHCQSNHLCHLFGHYALQNPFIWRWRPFFLVHDEFGGLQSKTLNILFRRFSCKYLPSVHWTPWPVPFIFICNLWVPLRP